MDHTSPTTMPREPKRVSMACTSCRHKKLKCRPAPASPNSTQRKCQRCAEANLECIFVPVSSEQPASTSPTPQYYQFRVDPAHYDPPYGAYAWQEQSEVYLNDPTSAMPNLPDSNARAPSGYEGYGNAPLHPGLGLPQGYQVPSGWPPAYPMQPQGQGFNPPPGDGNNNSANPMHYQIPTPGPSWQGNATQQHAYPTHAVNRDYQGHLEGETPQDPAWR
ncbi:hypothetical protein CVT26_001566 [Gymnopilus dilepis]|uniref:Zn(2)-C6 fungal-type domain-containing protein n=1 Tax=Gymnopilus dilepis TaxID=231916 RepID=A0A409VTJ0_9AGAR|nr:hypothetical protein CVT26_001566 [Gymnopilus dilepis]